MKGIVFTELIEMVESELGIELADRMIRDAETPNDGAYTAVGTYDHAELIKMVVALSSATNVPVPTLVKTFGKYLFIRFRELYPKLFLGVHSAIDFLPMVETYIHVEVLKLYPDAELPSFDCIVNDEALEMTYRSTRPFSDLAEGLILACIDHFEDKVTVTRTDLGELDGTEAMFTLTPTRIRELPQVPEPCPN